MKISTTSLVSDTIKKIYPTATEIRFGTDIITIYCSDDTRVLSYCSFHQMMINNSTILE